MKYLLNLVLLFFILGCSKENPIGTEGPPAPTGTTPPGTFSIQVLNVTDNEVRISWLASIDPDADSVHYDVAVDDSVVAYDLVWREYTIKNLLPDRKYAISVIALDPDRDSKKITTNVRTMKSFFHQIDFINLGFDGYSFSNGIKTNDNGYLISGFGEYYAKGREVQRFLLKIDQEFQVEWLKIYALEGTPEALLQCSDNGYIATCGNLIMKVTATGDVIWTVTYPADYKILLTATTEDQYNNIFVSGFSNRKAQEDTVKYEYFIAKISSTGDQVWDKFGGKTILNEPCQMIALSDGRLVIFGRGESSGAVSGNIDNWKDTFWLMFLDDTGLFVSQSFYLNEMGGSDTPRSFLHLPGNGYLLFGTAFGWVGGYGVARSRFTRITEDGTVTWDKIYDLHSGGYNPGVRDYDPVEYGSYLVLSNDDEGENISLLTSGGGISSQILLNGFPVGFIIRKRADGRYVYVAGSGNVFVMNPDGYLGSLIEKWTILKNTIKFPKTRSEINRYSRPPYRVS